MTINVNRYTFIDTLKRCKNFIDPKIMIEKFYCIQCKIEDEHLHLFAADNVKGFEINIPCVIEEEDIYKAFVLSPCVEVKKKGGDLVKIIIDKYHVTIRDEYSSNVYDNNLAILDDTLTLEKFVPKDEPTTIIYFNAEHLSKALKDVKGLIRIDIYNDKTGVIISDKNEEGKALVLPVNPNTVRI